MKFLFAFGLAVVFPALPASAQIGSQHALGGNRAIAGQSRPLGGIAPPPFAGRGRTGGRSANARPFAYSFYVPNYFDSYWGMDQYYSPPPPTPIPQQDAAAAVPPAPPVIINQYFGVQPPYQGQPQQQDASPSSDPQPVSGDTYYLIAYKNHSVYTALAYWVEDKTLNYVTAGNTHNQASLDLIDMDLTKTLNQARGVPFSIAGK
jgi:hypothetical protein